MHTMCLIKGDLCFLGFSVIFILLWCQILAWFTIRYHIFSLCERLHLGGQDIFDFDESYTLFVRLALRPPHDDIRLFLHAHKWLSIQKSLFSLFHVSLTLLAYFRSDSVSNWMYLRIFFFWIKNPNKKWTATVTDRP